PITARLLADLITVAGADRFLTIDLHAGQIQGFFTIPTDELTARYLFIDYVRTNQLTDHAVVVSPDVGAVRRARDFAHRINLPLAIIEKRRSLDGHKTEMYNLIGDVAGMTCMLIDDEIDTAGTLTQAAYFLKEAGATDIIAFATHAVFSDPAAERLGDAPIDRLVVTNSLPIPPEKRQRIGDKLDVLSVGPLLGETIRRIHLGVSVGAMFQQ
ncbi:MAG TPA: ribose-phosphate diphosphokinase, partial [Anaerolineae bacterium]|nr:ribose-phosphate diphosphokinase [Anaerolineae bacterium]